MKGKEQRRPATTGEMSAAAATDEMSVSEARAQLGLPPSELLTPAGLRAAFRRCVLACHPDRQSQRQKSVLLSGLPSTQPTTVDAQKLKDARDLLQTKLVEPPLEVWVLPGTVCKGAVVRAQGEGRKRGGGGSCCEVLVPPGTKDGSILTGSSGERVVVRYARLPGLEWTVVLDTRRRASSKPVVRYVVMLSPRDIVTGCSRLVYDREGIPCDLEVEAAPRKTGWHVGEKGMRISLRLKCCGPEDVDDCKSMEMHLQPC
jgi:hypothetical protein